MRDSVLLGAGVGATGGALLGNQIGTQDGNTEKGTWTGAATGAVLGGLVGYLGGKSKQAQDQSLPNQVKSSEPKTPSLSSPEVRRIWVPAKIENNKYIEGHYEFIIERQSVWIDQ